MYSELQISKQVTIQSCSICEVTNSSLNHIFWLIYSWAQKVMCENINAMRPYKYMNTVYNKSSTKNINTRVYPVHFRVSIQVHCITLGEDNLYTSHYERCWWPDAWTWITKSWNRLWRISIYNSIGFDPFTQKQGVISKTLCYSLQNMIQHKEPVSNSSSTNNPKPFGFHRGSCKFDITATKPTLHFEMGSALLGWKKANHSLLSLKLKKSKGHSLAFSTFTYLKISPRYPHNTGLKLQLQTFMELYWNKAKENKGRCGSHKSPKRSSQRTSK